MTSKEQLLYLIEYYHNGEYRINDFTSQFEKIYDSTNTTSEFSNFEDKLLKQIWDMVIYFSPYPEDHRLWKGYTSEEDVREKVNEIYTKLLEYYKKRLILCLTLLLLTSCSDEIYMNETTTFALDTIITMKISTGDDEILSDCVSMINEYEQIFSRTIPDSDISNFNDSIDGIMNPSDSTLELITKSIDIATKTDGQFNPALEPVTSLWKEDSIPAKIDIDLTHIDYTQIHISDGGIYKTDPGIRLDFGGIAKGYICEKVTEYLITQNVEYGILSFGGNISAFGTRPDGEKWKVGIRNPYDESDIVGNLCIDGGYVSVSGDYQRYFEVDGKRYHHIIDPSTGYPVDNGVHSVAVWCYDGTLADALSTALFVMGVDEGMKYHTAGIYEFEVMFITKSGITMSEGFEMNFIEKAT